MANIDLQSLISQLSASGGATTGAKAGGPVGVTGQLFGSILSQQQPRTIIGDGAGNGLPPGNGLPSEIAFGAIPATVSVANMLASMAQMPAQSPSLPIQTLQTQLKQLMASDPVSETAIDDLTALTNLLAGIDTLSLQPKVSVSAALNSTDTSGRLLLDETQLLQAAQEMGIDPAVAGIVLQATKAEASVNMPIATASMLASHNPPNTSAPAMTANLINPQETDDLLPLANKTAAVVLPQPLKTSTNWPSAQTVPVTQAAQTASVTPSTHVASEAQISPAESIVQPKLIDPAVSPNQAAPAVRPDQVAPVMPATQAEVAVQANQTTSAVSPNQAAPAVRPDQVSPVMPATQAEVAVQANQVMSAVSPNQAAPAVRPDQVSPVMPATQAEVAVQANQVMSAVSPNQTVSVAQATAGQNPTNNAQLANNQIQAQVVAQKITDEVVIQLRQTGTQAVPTTTANSAQTLSAQDFFNRRAAPVSTAASQAMRGAPAVDNIVMRFPSVLLQKLEQVSATSQTATAVSTEAISTPMTGASFNSMAQMQSLVGSGQTTVTSAEVPVAEGGSRLLSLLAADNPAQQAARNIQNQIGQQLQRMVRGGQWQANISLNPARLGQIKINMTMEDGVLKTQLLSANQGVRELLEGGIPRLRELLEESGLQLGQLDVASDTASQQFTNQQSETGELSQVSITESAEAENTEQRTSSHDGDLDTFA